MACASPARVERNGARVRCKRLARYYHILLAGLLITFPYLQKIDVEVLEGNCEFFDVIVESNKLRFTTRLVA